MAYSGIVRRILVSCPGDVPDGDLATIHRTINRWNGVYGEQFATVVVPISWGEHAAAQFGQSPQEVLNQQIVDTCDGCIAMFANRLGTPTKAAESGTAEEISRLADSGKYVAVLHSTREVDASRLDHDQAKSLDEYLRTLQEKALVLSYKTEADLARHVDNILAQAVARDSARAELQLRADESRLAEVWPRVALSERIKTDSKGRVRTSRDWKLVLHNTGSAPAKNVRFGVDDDTWQIMTDAGEGEPDVAVLAPGGEAAFHLLATMGTSTHALCTVNWEDERGLQENSATLRLT